MLYDATIVDLEFKLSAADMLLRFFKSYLVTQPNLSIRVADSAVQSITGKERLEVSRDPDGYHTIVKLVSKTTKRGKTDESNDTRK